MRPSSRHLYPAWLRPGTTRDAAAADTGQAPQADRAWRLWEVLRDFDRRYATFVDIALTVVLFVLCSGWTFSDHAGHPNLVVVAALIFPLVFRRRAPEAVFAVIATVAFVQWLVSGPALADVSLLVAMYTVAVESDWLFVVIAAAVLEAGVIMATIRWTVTSNDLKTFVFLTGLAMASLLAGVVVHALRSQLDWLAERAARLEVERDQQASLAAAAERARIAREMHDVVSHNIQVMVTLADAAARATDPDRAADAMHEVSSTGRQALTDMRRMLGVLRDEPASSGTDTHDKSESARRGALAPQPGLGDLDALVERVRGTGLTVSIERAGRPFEVSGAAGLTVYRIVQEALTNALKHAEDPASVEVCLDFEDPDISRARARRRAHKGRHARGRYQRQRPPAGTCQWIGRRPRRHRHGRAGCGLWRQPQRGTGAVRRLGGADHPARLQSPGRPVTVRVVLADDQALLRKGFRMILEAEDGIEIVGEAADGSDAVRLVELYQPDVVLMDVRMPVLDGIEATRAIATSPAGSETRVLILTTFDLDEYAFSALRAGASGFLLKDVPPAELVGAIRTVARGDAVVSPRVTRRLLEEYSDNCPTCPPTAAAHPRPGTRIPHWRS